MVICSFSHATAIHAAFDSRYAFSSPGFKYRRNFVMRQVSLCATMRYRQPLVLGSGKVASNDSLWCAYERYFSRRIHTPRAGTEYKKQRSLCSVLHYERYLCGKELQTVLWLYGAQCTCCPTVRSHHGSSSKSSPVWITRARPYGFHTIQHLFHKPGQFTTAAQIMMQSVRNEKE